MGYREVELKTINKKSKESIIRVNIDSISYYRSFIPEQNEGSHSIVDTMIYLNGNETGQRIRCTPDWLSRKIKKNVDLSHLTNENYEKVIALIRELS